MSDIDTNESKDWMCYGCDQYRQRVMFIPNSQRDYYCEACLFDAIRDEDLYVSRENSSHTCDECGSDETLSCGDCAPRQFDLHSEYNCDHDYCHDDCHNSCEECGNDVDVALCDSCNREKLSEAVSMECEGCKSTAMYHYCPQHDPHVATTGPSLEPKTGTKRADISDDGSTVMVDGITIQF